MYDKRGTYLRWSCCYCRFFACYPLGPILFAKACQYYQRKVSFTESIFCFTLYFQRVARLSRICSQAPKWLCAPPSYKPPAGNFHNIFFVTRFDVRQISRALQIVWHVLCKPLPGFEIARIAWCVLLMVSTITRYEYLTRVPYCSVKNWLASFALLRYLVHATAEKRGC